MASTSDKFASQLQALLNSGQYEQMVQLLNDASSELNQAADTAGATILTAAAQVCLACAHLQQELAIRARTQAELLAQEKAMKQQLESLLQLASNPERETAVFKPQPPTPAPPTPNTFVSKLKQRLQHWFPSPSKPAAPRPGGLPLLPQEKPPIEPQPLSVADNNAHAAAGSPTNGRTGAHDPEYATPSLIIYTLGPFRVYQNDQLITDWNGLKGLMILKYLVANFGKPIPKDILMDVFWPDVDFESARRNLHQAVYSLRQTLRKNQRDFQHILFENECYLFNPKLKVWIDFLEFEKQVQQGRRLERENQLNAATKKYGVAEGLYQGNFLDEDLYEEWPQLERERLRTLYLDTTDRLSKYYLEKGECTIAVNLCQKILALDNCHEGAYRRLIRCFAVQGQRHLAIRTYKQCQAVLEAELALDPTAETVAVYHQAIATAQPQ